MKVAGILLAGGLGKRLGGDTPKQLLKIGDKTILQYCLGTMFRCIRDIVVVAHREWLGRVNETINTESNFPVIEGGETRQLSVYNALKFLQAKNPEVVIIHDGVRPFVRLSVIKACIDSASRFGSGVCVKPQNDSLGLLEKDCIIGYPDRSRIYPIETPQAFHYQTLLKYHQKALENDRVDYTDDSQVYALGGNPPRAVFGSNFNMKITTADDYELAKCMVDWGFIKEE